MYKKEKHPIKLIGTLSVNEKGFGFVELDSGSVFVPPSFLHGGIAGDQVEVQIDPQSDPERPSGAITRILERKFGTIVGCLVPWHGGWALRPLRRELPALLPLTRASCARAYPAPREGQWARATLAIPTDNNFESGLAQAELCDVFGQTGEVTSDLDAIVEEFHIPETYTDDDEAAAAKLNPAKVRRRDYTTHTVVTIDPVDARDYDDALSCEPGQKTGEIVVGVHIADVACYVTPKSPLDGEARKRCFTSYLPGRTLPMLPRALANRQCSLQAGVPRLAHSVFIRYNTHTGEVRSWERCHTTICVTQRLCYEQVQQYFDGSPFEAEPGVLELLDRLNGVARLLRHRRQTQEQFLPMAMPEIRVLCTENPSQILGVQKSEDNPSHQLVEEFMLSANECIANELQKLRLPGIYRNHQAPDEDKMAQFTETATLMMGEKVRSLGTRRGIVHFLRRAEKSPLKDVLYMAFLRQLPRAVYETESLGHFGLGKERYCHFTSPIRRYADLLVHQQLLLHDTRRKVYEESQVIAIADECTSHEYNCDQAEFAAEDRMKIRYLDHLRREDDAFTVLGEVCRTSKLGAQLYLPEYGLMAFVNDAQLPNYWTFDHLKLDWTNLRNGDRLFVTQSRQFKIAVADPIRGELLLTPVTTEMPSPEKDEAGTPSKELGDWNELEVYDPPRTVANSRGRGRATARSSRGSGKPRSTRKSRKRR
ncbi:MAG: VacB/RNase II family 3'-5' exoribonuclease [Victivallales bacterium]|nr:VacB/RNase II family 3'-5' exoribonuclease [Victivallales bacterium]